MNLKAKLDQCQSDIATLQVEEHKLKKRIEEEELPEFGDIVTCKSEPRWKRVILYSNGKLWAFDRYGDFCGDPKFYKKTGQNIFNNVFWESI